MNMMSRKGAYETLCRSFPRVNNAWPKWLGCPARFLPVLYKVGIPIYMYIYRRGCMRLSRSLAQTLTMLFLAHAQVAVNT